MMSVQMKYFDTHLHIASATEQGLSMFLRHLDAEKNLVGGNLILNTPEEVDLVLKHIGRFPRTLNLIPYFDPAANFPVALTQSGWFKIHPAISGITIDRIESLCDAVVKAGPRGIVIHCFPWGANLKHNVSLSLVIAIAVALPQMPVLVAHGGGYESWQFRSHAGVLRNVLFDFSVSMSYYQGSDLLRPFQRYLRYSPERILFGSDWPSAQATEQLDECARLAGEIGIMPEQLEQLFLSNSRRLWPEAFA